LKLTNNSYIWT